MNRPRPPRAIVLTINGNSVTVICPYCYRKHTHEVPAHGWQHFAPGCGQFRTPEQRAQGYGFGTHPQMKQKRRNNND